jgi:hypothetical protein
MGAASGIHIRLMVGRGGVSPGSAGVAAPAHPPSNSSTPSMHGLLQSKSARSPEIPLSLGGDVQFPNLRLSPRVNSLAPYSPGDAWPEVHPLPGPARDYRQAHHCGAAGVEGGAARGPGRSAREGAAAVHGENGLPLFTVRSPQPPASSLHGGVLNMPSRIDPSVGRVALVRPGLTQPLTPRRLRPRSTCAAVRLTRRTPASTATPSSIALRRAYRRGAGWGLGVSAGARHPQGAVLGHVRTETTAVAATALQ